VHSVLVRQVQNETLVTAIEILSPANKSGRGLGEYRDKVMRMHRTGVNAIEIDLLRQGGPALQPSSYRVLVFRRGEEAAGVWPIGLRDRLPLIPIPLARADPDVALDLQGCLDQAYDEGGLARLIVYSGDPPPPALDAADREWVLECASHGLRR
jgi:hypothetical protein